jgi:hypothetical protein
LLSELPVSLNRFAILSLRKMMATIRRIAMPAISSAYSTNVCPSSRSLALGTVFWPATKSLSTSRISCLFPLFVRAPTALEPNDDRFQEIAMPVSRLDQYGARPSVDAVAVMRGSFGIGIRCRDGRRSSNRPR